MGICLFQHMKPFIFGILSFLAITSKKPGSAGCCIQRGSAGAFILHPHFVFQNSLTFYRFLYPFIGLSIPFFSSSKPMSLSINPKVAIFFFTSSTLESFLNVGKLFSPYSCYHNRLCIKYPALKQVGTMFLLFFLAMLEYVNWK